MRRLAGHALRAAARAVPATPPLGPPLSPPCWRPLTHTSIPWCRPASTSPSAAASTSAAADPADAPPDSAAPAPRTGGAFAVDFTSMATLVAAVRLTAVPGRLDDVVAVDRATLALRLTVADGDSATAPLWLWFAWGVHPRLAVGPPPPPGGASAAGVDAFAGQLLAELKGKVLVASAIGAEFDRVARLDWAPRVGAPADRLLILEANGRRPTVALTDACVSNDGGDGEPADGPPTKKGNKAKHKPPKTAPPLSGVPPPRPRPGIVLAVPPGAAPVRVRHPGATPVRLAPRARYTLPTLPSKVTPCLSEPFTVWRANVAAAGAQLEDAGKEPAVRAALVASYAGVSPSLATDLVAGIGFFGTWHVPCAALNESDWTCLHGAWTGWLTAVAEDKWAPGRRSDGRPNVMGPGDGDAPPGSPAAVVAAAAAVDAATVAAVVSFWRGGREGVPASLNSRGAMSTLFFFPSRKSDSKYTSTNGTASAPACRGGTHVPGPGGWTVRGRPRWEQHQKAEPTIR